MQLTLKLKQYKRVDKKKGMAGIGVNTAAELSEPIAVFKTLWDHTPGADGPAMASAAAAAAAANGGGASASSSPSSAASAADGACAKVALEKEISVTGVLK